MSDSNDLVKTEAIESKENLVDINDQNILDYDDEIENNNVNTHSKEKAIKTEVDDDSDGEIKSANQSDNDLDDGEVPSPRYDRNVNASSSNLKEDASNKQEKQQESEEKDEEEDGEINDGEKAKKVFVPRVLCKYYQRGKCTWGRGCKFLHPGVNDTGNYNFLEFQDPNAAVFQQAAKNLAEASEASSRPAAPAAEMTPTESAWERGLRHAKEMKEKALRRKQNEGEQFADKKMNLSLKEFETEKENDERYVNVERMATADDDELEDEDLSRFKSWRLNQEKSGQPQHSEDKVASNRNDDKHYNQRTARPKRGSISPERDNKYSSRQKSDDWHDPWDRSKNRKKQTSRDYNSSDSDSRSRSRSDSRSSYSSRSSSSYRTSSYSSRSNSRSPTRYSSKSKKTERQSRQQRADVAAKKPAQGVEKADLAKSLKAKPLPGRQISDFSLKKAGLDADKSAKKNRKNRSNSRSSTSSNDSYKSNDDNDSDEDYSRDESGSDDDSDDEFSKKKKNKSKPSKKRTAQDTKGTSDAKKQKLSEKPGQSIDKKQAIKDQLKLLESALKKKTSAK